MKVALNEKESKLLAAVEKAGDGFMIAGAGARLYPEADREGKNTDGSLKSDSWVRNSLRKLVGAGLVKQVGRGLYRATGKKFEDVGAGAAPRERERPPARRPAKRPVAAKAKPRRLAPVRGKAAAKLATKRRRGKFELVSADLPSDMPDDEVDDRESSY